MRVAMGWSRCGRDMFFGLARSIWSPIWLAGGRGGGITRVPRLGTHAAGSDDVVRTPKRVMGFPASAANQPMQRRHHQ